MRLLVSSTPKILPRLVDEFAPWLGTLVTPRNGALAQALRLWESHRIPWACDNDCFQGLDEQAYRRMLDSVAGHPGCLFVTVPDMVGRSDVSWGWFDEWSHEIDEASGEMMAGRIGQPLAYVIQDGHEFINMPWDNPFDNPREDLGAVFVGGSTEWKLGTHARKITAEAKRRGLHVHVGRCNSKRRYRAALDMGADSVDGTNVCMFPDKLLPTCLRWLRDLDAQPTLFAAA